MTDRGFQMWVEALRRGKHLGLRSVDAYGRGTPEPIRVTRRDVADAAGNVESFIDDGLRIWVLSCHDNYACDGPRPPAGSCYGHVVDLHHDEANDVLALNLSIRDPRAEQMLVRLGHVSPGCARNVTIGGEFYPGLAIGHVASTDRPAQRRQRAINMSWCPLDDF